MNKLAKLFLAGALVLIWGINTSLGQEVTYSVGPATGAQNLQGLGFSWADVNQDGFLDLFIEPDNLIFNNVGSFSRAVTSGVTSNVITAGSIFADFNGDGYADVLVTQGGATPFLFTNSGGIRFVNATASSGDLATVTPGTTGQMYGLAAADYDRDGYLDIAWAGGAGQAGGDANTGGGPDGKLRLLRGGPGGFTNVGTTSGLPVIDTTKFFESWSPAFVDANNDGYPDLFVPSFRNGINIGVSRSVLYLNDGSGQFILPPFGTGPADTGLVVDDTVRHYSAIASAWGDFNNDGIMDLAISGLANDSACVKGEGKVPSGFHLLRGKGDGTFTDVTAASGITYTPASRALSWGDYNNDGNLDLLMGGGFAPPIVWRNNGDGTFKDVSSLVGIPTANANSRSCQFVDYDNDGFLDIYAAAAGADILLHNGGNLNNWIAFRPQGAGHNLMAIGARFTVYNGARKQIRNIEAGGSGGATGGNNYATFGIGSATSVDSVAVWWPDGLKQTFTGLGVDRYWSIKEGSIVSAPAGVAANNITGTNFTVLWSPVAQATGYQLDVSQDNFVTFLPGYSAKPVGNVTRFVVSGLSPGTDYWVRVRAENAIGASPSSNAMQVLTYASTYTLSQWEIPFAQVQSLTDLTSADYRLIGIPGGGGSDIGQFLLPGLWKQDWQVYWDNGKASGYYQEYTQGDPAFQCNTGKAFWLLCKANWKPSGVITTAQLDSNAETVIPLTSAQQWNLITDPFDRPISWGAVQARNNISSPLYAWRLQTSSIGWDTAAQMVPLQGYLFPNTSGQTSLRIPYRLTFPGATMKIAPLNNVWRIHVNVTCGPYQDRTTCFGVMSSASPAPGQSAMPKPRHFKEIPDIYFDRRDWNADYPEFATDIRPPTGDIAEWDLTLRSELKKQVAIDFAGVETIPRNQSVVLIDEGMGRYQDLRESSRYVKQPEQPVTVLKVLVGDPDAVLARAAQCVPTEFSLLQNYPNPFNPSTTIPVVMPVQGVLALEIFNILGQKVKVLCQGEIEAGTHYFEWDGRNDNGSTVASGPYIYRMSVVGRSVLSRAMLLLK